MTTETNLPPAGALTLTTLSLTLLAVVTPTLATLALSGKIPGPKQSYPAGITSAAFTGLVPTILNYTPAYVEIQPDKTFTGTELPNG